MEIITGFEIEIDKGALLAWIRVILLISGFSGILFMIYKASGF